MKEKLEQHFAGKDFEKELFVRDVVSALMHVLFSVEFFALGVPEMGAYNLISPIFFVLMAYGVWSFKLKNIALVDFLITVEIFIHSIMAVYFTGFELGFQNMLLIMVFPVVIYVDDKRSIRFNAIRSISAGGVFAGLYVLMELGLLVPKYHFSTIVSLVAMTVLTLLVFHFIYSQSLSSFGNYESHMKEYSEREIRIAQQLTELHKRVIRNIAGVIEERDTLTGEHTERTTIYVEKICRELVEEGKFTDELTEDMITVIIQSASLHDIGKIRTPDVILNKPDKLTTEEFEVIKRHTTDGGDIIRKIFSDVDDKMYEDVAYKIAMYHHEKWNGNGYPSGKKEDEIPLCARIMAVADVYDALISKRVYKPAFSEEEAMNIIKGDIGKQFDPTVAEAFIRSMQLQGMQKSAS